MKMDGLLVCFTRLVSGFFVAALSWQFAFAGESSFYSQCNKLLPVADEFARNCLQRARPFSRTFYPSGGNTGEVESYSTYFQTLDAPSHFLLGCVLDFKHKIDFVGLFYSSRPLDMSHFAEYKVLYVDPNDNVGLAIDGAQSNFVAIRQFVTDLIPARLIGRPKNCEDPHIEVADGANVAKIERLRTIDQTQIEYCYGRTCEIGSYSTFGAHEVPIIFNFQNLVFIDGNGALMLREDYFKRACSLWKRPGSGVYGLLYEMCSK
jgi:hypothetical protein